MRHLRINAATRSSSESDPHWPRLELHVSKLRKPAKRARARRDSCKPHPDEKARERTEYRLTRKQLSTRFRPLNNLLVQATTNRERILPTPNSTPTPAPCAACRWLLRTVAVEPTECRGSIAD